MKDDDMPRCSERITVARAGLHGDWLGHPRIPSYSDLVTMVRELRAVAEGCLAFFAWQQAQQSDVAPDERWLKPLREAVRKAEDV